MSKLKELMQTLCPNGVEYISISELCELRNGYTPSKAMSEYWEGGTIPWFRMEDIRQNGRILSDSIQHITPQAVKGGKLFPANSIILATTATIGEHALITVDFLSNQRFTNLSIRESLTHRVNIKFFYYYMFIVDEWCKNNINISGFASVDMGKFKKLEIPVPPREVQEEIVRILDKFTTLEAELEKELEAELECRKRQYQHYRDSLLNFTPPHEENKVEFRRLGDCLAYEQPTKYIVHSIEYEKEGLPVLTAGQTFILGYTSETDGVYEASKDNPVVIFDDFTTSFHWVDFNFKVKSSAMKMLRPISNDILFKYVYYAMQCITYETLEHSRQWISKYSNLVIPIPPIEEQRRIVEILDKFEALTTDLCHGLPAEIEARRRQYEHYRDQLLTFKRLTA